VTDLLNMDGFITWFRKDHPKYKPKGVPFFVCDDCGHRYPFGTIKKYTEKRDYGIVHRYDFTFDFENGHPCMNSSYMEDEECPYCH
jgi:hypothetical protein